MNYKSNPYLMPRMAFPPYGQPMKSPEQYQADLLRQIQPNLDLYNQQYTAYQQQQTMMTNSGQYVKVTNYEEVKQIQAPSDGRPVIIIDDDNGFLYSKKFDNGQEYIKAFRLVPNEVVEESVTNDTEKSKLDIICDKIEEFGTRLAKLEGKDNGDGGHITE